MRRRQFDKGRLVPPFSLLLLAPLLYAADEEWLACDTIDDNSKRLACYDQVARAKGSMHDVHARKAPDFGKVDSLVEPDLTIESRIDRVGHTSTGRTVMYLSNGQVWAENEPGRRRIRAGQNVTIKKAFMTYSMKLESGIIVSVNRLE